MGASLLALAKSIYYVWPFILHSLFFFKRLKFTCVRTEEFRGGGNPPLVLKR